MRINKFLSQCGVTSRRGAEKLIEEGRVKVNGEVIVNFGTIIDTENDEVLVDDKIANLVEENYYIVLNKPRYVLTSLSDPFRRRTVTKFIKKAPARVYPVGRLDFDTDGVLLMTNDGELAFRLAHPKYQITRIYHAIVEGTFGSDCIAKIEDGIQLEDGHLGTGKVRILTAGMENSKVEISMTEGHKREVKQLLASVGHKVIKLRRVEFAGIRTGALKWGQWRFLEEDEVKTIKELVGIEPEKK